MTKPIHVRMAMDLFVEDEQAMREAALQRLRDAWSADEDFPYSDASDVPFDEVVNSLVADALPLELPGARRGQLSVETESDGEETADSDESATTEANGDSDDGDSDDGDSDDGDSGGGDSGGGDSGGGDSGGGDSDDERADPVDKQF